MERVSAGRESPFLRARACLGKLSTTVALRWPIATCHFTACLERCGNVTQPSAMPIYTITLADLTEKGANQAGENSHKT